LPRTEVNAIVPASKSNPAEPPPRLGIWVRGALTGVVLGLIFVFTMAWLLDPYNEDGSAKRMGTHQGKPLGLLPCSFYQGTGVPCPACGMTTSFALLVRGDVPNSLRANWVGTLLAAFGMLLIPWTVVSVVRNRSLFVRSLETALIIFISTLLVLMLLRWGIVLACMWHAGELPW
jgi:putative effector of murein hydrolase LrgA (UPF0299 family)